MSGELLNVLLQIDRELNRIAEALETLVEMRVKEAEG